MTNSASSIARGDARTSRLSAIIIPAICGASFSLGLCRLIYESTSHPLAQAFGMWPVVLFIAAASGLLAAWAHRRLSVRLGIESPELAAAFLPGLLPLIAVIAPDVNLLRAKVLLVGAVGGMIVLLARANRSSLAPLASFRSRLVDWLAPLVPAILTFTLYLRTLAPTVGEADTFEFQVDIARLAVAHPTGYPLFILLGKLFTLLPVGGTLAFRANLASAVFGTLAAVIGYLIARRLGSGRLIASLTALLIGVSPTLWSRSVEAEVYSLHAALVAGLLLFMLTLQRASQPPCAARQGRPNHPVPPDRAGRTTLLLAGLFGLALTNHLTTLLLAPAAILALVLARPRLSLRQWLGAAGLFLLGLSVYLYIPIRWPAVNHGEVMTARMFFDYLTGSQSQGALQITAFFTDFSRYGILARKMLAEFGWPGALLALLGLITLAIRNRRAAAITLVAYIGLSFFPLSFYVPDPDFSAFLIAPHLVEALWIGMGMYLLLNIVGQAYSVFRIPYPDSSLRGAQSALASSFFLLPFFLIWTTLPRVDKSGEWEAYDLGQFILSQPLASGALVLADSEKIAPLYYLQVAEGARPDLDIRVLPDEEAYRAALDEGLAAGQTVYLGRYLPGLAGTYHLRSAGPLVEASTEPLLSPPAMTKVGADFGGQIQLLGHNADLSGFPRPDRSQGREGAISAGESLPVTLYWQASTAPDNNYLVNLRLSNSQGDIVWNAPPRIPAGGTNPTTAWTTGEVVFDFHFVNLPPALSPGRYVLEAALLLPFSETGLAVNGETWQPITALEVVRPISSPQPTQAARALYSTGLVLTGYDVPETVAPGSKVSLTLYWRSFTPRGGTIATIPPAIELQIRPGNEAPLIKRFPVPSELWSAGDNVAQSYTFTAPREPGSLSLYLSVLPGRARCGWLEPYSIDCSLPLIQVSGAAADPDAVNFDNQILLTDFQLETLQADQGGVVKLNAEWRGLQTMSEDYTVFVHLIGPDGLVHGQLDVWPGQGTRPTSGWTPGESFRDTYEVRVPDDAPAGEYSVEVGWYLLATGDRLPVLGEDGAPVDDKILKQKTLLIRQSSASMNRIGVA